MAANLAARAFRSTGGLIDSYGKAVRENPKATISNLDKLLDDLRKASIFRNVLCHGSWRVPDAQARSLPFFVNKNNEIFETHIDVAVLVQLQRHAAELACVVVTTVTHMGWQFPGSSGLGNPIRQSQRG